MLFRSHDESPLLDSFCPPISPHFRPRLHSAGAPTYRAAGSADRISGSPSRRQRSEKPVCWSAAHHQRLDERSLGSLMFSSTRLRSSATAAAWIRLPFRQGPIRSISGQACHGSCRLAFGCPPGMGCPAVRRASPARRPAAPLPERRRCSAEPDVWRRPVPEPAAGSSPSLPGFR